MQLLHRRDFRYKWRLDHVMMPLPPTGACVHVRHFFTAAGGKAFPRLFADHQRAVSSFPGFLALRHSPVETNGVVATLDMILEFENDALLKAWRSSPQHAQIAAAYRPFWAREPEVTFTGAESR